MFDYKLFYFYSCYVFDDIRNRTPGFSIQRNVDTTLITDIYIRWNLTVTRQEHLRVLLLIEQSLIGYDCRLIRVFN